MIKVKVIGGLGNQLFQYATARALAEKLGTTTTLDISAYQSYDVHPYRLDKFNCKASFSSKPSLFQKIISKRIFKNIFNLLGLLGKYHFESGLVFDEKLFLLQNNSNLFGYFQTEKYFVNIRQKLLDELSLTDPFNDVEQDISNQIKECNSVAIHIRRGDYISNTNANNVHGVCDSSYFTKSLKYLKDKSVLNENTHLFIFSDDINWCRANLDFGYKITFVEGSSERPEVDMKLMSQCRHQIISNSTFSWWGAWLNQNPNKFVIAPNKWFQTEEHDSNDIIPDNWVKL